MPKRVQEPVERQLVKAPVELFERLDRWCERMQRERNMTMRPGRPAAIRYILDQFLQREEKRIRTRAARRPDCRAR
jgi:predicted transcriptional regulator